MIYFIKSNNYIKIGTSGSVVRRAREVKVGNPNSPFVLLTLDLSSKYEKIFHKRYAQYRHSGEWFRIEGKLERFLRRKLGLKSTIKNLSIENFNHSYPDVPVKGTLVYIHKGKYECCVGQVVKVLHKNVLSQYMVKILSFEGLKGKVVCENYARIVSINRYGY